VHLKRYKRGSKIYWELVESHRTQRGPRQRTVAYLGTLDEPGLQVLEEVGALHRRQRTPSLFAPDTSTPPKPEWVEINAADIRVERTREFGGFWLGCQLLQRLELDSFLEGALPAGREEIPWAVMAQILILCRLCRPSSELAIAQVQYERSALEDLLGVPADKVNDDRLYRALDQLLVHKAALEQHLRQRLGELFGLEYDLLLYDSTTTYFEGQCAANPQAQRGYSRDQRPDCKQVCIALVVTRSGLPLSYEVFAGNRADVTTTEEVIRTVEARHGQASRIWVMDRGMVSEANMAFLRQPGRRYIVGTARKYLQRFRDDLCRADGWQQLLNGVQVKLCQDSEGGSETFILCRSEARQAKEHAMQQQAEMRFETGLEAIRLTGERQRLSAATAYQRLGRLKARHSRAAALFQVEVREKETGNPKAGVEVHWTRNNPVWEWNQLSHGCYLLRTNITDWTPQELWQAYIQLTEAEDAFRIHKQDLSIRPLWHQKPERVQAHILVCFLAYVLWKMLGQMCVLAGLGDEPRRVLDEISQIRLVDVVLPTRSRILLRKRCVTRPTPAQAILLHKLGLRLPRSAHIQQM
jgi:transposase